jgi:hypothetical protein
MSDSMAARLYPDMAAAEASPTPAPVPTPAPAETAAPVSEVARMAATILPDHELYDGHVNLMEAPASPADIFIEIPAALRTDSPQQAVELQATRAAMAGVGLGATAAREMWEHVARTASRPSNTNTAESARAALEAAWGSQTDARLAVAKEAYRDYAARDPNGAAVIERLGLGNDPKFIMKIAAMASRIKARG